MKRWILGGVLCLVGCGEPVPTGTFAPRPADTLVDHAYAWEDQEINGMKYRVYFKTRNSSQTGYTVFAVNLTKDELEVQLLKRQLQENK